MKILLAVDGSEPSDLAVGEVAGRPWPAGTEVRVLSVVQRIALPATVLAMDDVSGGERYAEELGQHAGEMAARAVQSLQGSGLAAEAVVRHGDPRNIIVDEAGDWGADLIVVGSHGYTGLQRWLLGSVAQSVVSHAPCSVEVVRGRVVPEARAPVEIPTEEELARSEPGVAIPPA